MTVGVHAMPGAAPRMTRATLAPMTGKIEAYDHLPETARAIREQVFMSVTGGLNSTSGMPWPFICWRSTGIGPWRHADSMRIPTIPISREGT